MMNEAFIAVHSDELLWPMGLWFQRCCGIWFIVLKAVTVVCLFSAKSLNFLSHLLLAGCDIGVHFSICPSVGSIIHLSTNKHQVYSLQL